jgi:hypothetical protein
MRLPVRLCAGCVHPFGAVGDATTHIVDVSCSLVSEVGATCLVVDVTAEAGDDLVTDRTVLGAGRDGWGCW